MLAVESAQPCSLQRVQQVTANTAVSTDGRTTAAVGSDAMHASETCKPGVTHSKLMGLQSTLNSGKLESHTEILPSTFRQVRKLSFKTSHCCAPRLP